MSSGDGEEADKKEVVSLRAAIAEKDAQIEKLQERLKGEAHLQEVIDELKEEKESLQERRHCATRGAEPASGELHTTP